MTPVEQGALQIGDREICELTNSIWESMVGLEVQRLDEPPPKKEGTKFLAGSVHITGSWEGTVMVACSLELARKVAAGMFGIEPEEVAEDEIQDALGEITNITGGSITNFASPSQLSIPSVSEEADYNVVVPGSQLVSQICFECEGQPLAVTLLRKAQEES